jgi:hypothetical protein
VEECRLLSPCESGPVNTVTRQPRIFTGTAMNVSVSPG